MNKNVSNIFVGLTLLVGLCCSCADKPTNGRTDTPSSGTMSFASDESFSPIVDELREIFQVERPQAKLNPIYTNEVDEINLLLKDSIYLAITSKKFTQKQLEYLKGKRYLPVSIPIAYDGLSLIINRNNTDSCITVADVKRILSGKVSQWSQINARSVKGNIEVVFDNPKSSTVQYCVDSLLNGQKIKSPYITTAKTSKEVIDYVEKTPNAIGIIGSNWLNDKRDTTNTTFKKNITVMSVSKMPKATEMNSWKPYQAYLLDGRYPFVRTIYALLNDPIDGLPWAFAHYMESPKGQLIIFKSGLLPMRGDITIRSVNVSSE